jgi:hypothetical protein
MCDLCENDSDCEHPVSFHSREDKPTPPEIETTELDFCKLTCLSEYWSNQNIGGKT